jgi:hypothetical protein
MTLETPSQQETLAELDSQAGLPLPSSDPLAPRLHRVGPTGRKHPDTGAGLLPDDDSFSAETSKTGPPTRGRAARGATPQRARPVTPLPSDEEATEASNALAGLLLLAGGLTAQVMPVTGMTLVKRSEMASKAILDIAKGNPALWKYLKWLATMSKYEEFGNFAASMVVAVGVDAKVMDPRGMFPQQLIPDVLAVFAAPEAEPVAPTDSAAQNGHREPTYASHVAADSIGGSDG